MNAEERKNLHIIQNERAVSYSNHYQNRYLFRQLPPELQEKYRQASTLVPTPVFDIYGRDRYTEYQWREIMNVAVDFGLQNPRLINPWYVSEDGWKQFQHQWQEADEEIFV